MTEAIVFLCFIMTGGVPILGESKLTAISGMRKNKLIFDEKKVNAEFLISLGRSIVFHAEL